MRFWRYFYECYHVRGKRLIGSERNFSIINREVTAFIVVATRFNSRPQLISKVRSISYSSNSQNDKLISALQAAIFGVLFMLISPFAPLGEQFNTLPEFETSLIKSLKIEKCITPVTSDWSHNSNLPEKNKAQRFNAQFATDPG